MTHEFSVRSTFTFLFGKRRAPIRRRHDKVRLSFDTLEERCVPDAGMSQWMSALNFNQFTGSTTLTSFGFGIDDGEPDRDRDGKSDISGIQKAPKFLGLDFDQTIHFGPGIESTGFHIPNPFGADPFIPTGDFGFVLDGVVSARFGIEYGFYINAGTASLLHEGTFSYDVQEGNAPAVISTGIATTAGSLYTISPKISAYADLVVEFSFSGHFEGAVFTSFGTDLPTFNIDEKINLFSINRQVTDDNGNYVFNPDGSPQFDGQIKYVGQDLIGGLFDTADLITDAREKHQQGAADKAEGETAKKQATTPDAKAAAQNKIDAADSKVAAGRAAEADVNQKTKTGGNKFGEFIVFGIEPADEDVGLLGLTGTLSVGGAVGVADVGLEVGSLTVTLPDINLIDKMLDPNGVLTASTLNFKDGSTQDQHRQLVDLTINVLSLVGVGTYSVNVGPLSIEATLAKYDISTVLAVSQTVAATPVPKSVQFVFADADTGAPLSLTSTVDAGAPTTSTTVSFIPGQTVRVFEPDSGAKVKVTPILTDAYRFENRIGLDLDISGKFSLLKFKAEIAGQTIVDTGYVYENTNPIYDTDLGNIFEKSFIVRSQPVALDSFVFGRPLADVSVSILAQPTSPVVVTAGNPNPQLDYTLRVSNAGPAVATGVYLTNRLPTQITFDPARSTPGLSLFNGIVAFELGDLDAGEFRDVLIAGNYVRGSGTSVSDSFGLTYDRRNFRDPNASNNFTDASASMQLPLIITATTESELRAAIATTNNAPTNGDVPVIRYNGDITLTQGELVVTRSVVIDGSEQATIDAGGNSRVFNFGAAGAQTYRLESLRLKNGNGGGANEGLGGAIQLIDSDGNDTLTLAGLRIFESTALTGASQGGALYVDGANLVIEDGSEGTFLSDNQARQGGAIALRNATANFLERVYFNHNAATVRGGAVYLESSGTGTAHLTINESYFDENQAPFGATIASISADGLASSVTYANSTFSSEAISTPVDTQFGIPMFTARYEHAAVTGPDGRIYAIGGAGSDFREMNKVEAYDPATQAWSPVAPMQSVRYDFAAALGADGRIYAIGGSGSNGHVNMEEAYNPSTNTWTTIARMPTERHALAAVAGADGRIYAMGGIGPGNIGSTVEAYDPSTNTWATVAPMSTVRTHFAAAAGADGRIYAIGGLDSAGNLLNTAEAYDPATNTWSTVAPMPTARYSLAAASSGGRIYAFGGRDGSNDVVANTVEMYDPTTNTWTSAAPMPDALYSLAAPTGADGRIYVLGGRARRFGGVDTVQTYDPAQNTWLPFAAPPLFSSSGSAATFASLGNNVASDGTGNLTAAGDQPDTQPGLFLSPQIIASGQNGYTVGSLSLAWPNVDFSTLQYQMRFNPQDDFRILGNILSLQESRQYRYQGTNTALVRITVAAQDTSTNQRVGPGTTEFNLSVVYVNQAPTSVSVAFTDPAGLPEDQAAVQQPGLEIGTVTGVDPDPDDVLHYVVDDARFQIVLDVNNVAHLYLKPGRFLNFEEEATIPLQITVLDAAGLHVTLPFTVNVKDVPEAPTTIIGGNGTLVAGQAGAPVGQLSTLGPAGIAMTFTYTVDDARFEVVTGLLKLKAGQSLLSGSSPIALRVTATDANNLSVVQPFAVNVRNPISVQAPAIPAALDAGASFSAQFTAEGGNGGPFTFEISAGALPAGLTLSSAGVLSGTPTGAGGSLFAVRATDSAGTFGNTSSATTMQINPVFVPPPQPVAPVPPAPVNIAPPPAPTPIRNAAPINLVPRRLVTVRSNRLQLMRLSCVDRDAGRGRLRVILRATSGKFVLDRRMLRVRGLLVRGNNTRSLSLTGDLSALNRLLRALKFGAPARRGNINIVMLTNDLSSLGARTDRDVFRVRVR